MIIDFGFFPGTLIFPVFYFPECLTTWEIPIKSPASSRSVSPGGLYLRGTPDYFHNPTSATNIFQCITFAFNVAVVVMDAASFPHCSALTDKRADAASHRGQALSELLRDNSMAKAIDLCSGWLKASAQMLTSGTSSIPDLWRAVLLSSGELRKTGEVSQGLGHISSQRNWALPALVDCFHCRFLTDSHSEQLIVGRGEMDHSL